MSFILKEGEKAAVFSHMALLLCLVHFCLSELKNWSQPTAIYLPLKQEE